MFSRDTYTSRRAELRRRVTRGGIVLLPGNTESPANYPGNVYHFRQDSTFLYFFGLDLPGMAAVIDVDSGKETLFADDLSMDDIIWTGPQPSVAELAHRCGVADTRPLGDIAEVVTEAVRRGRTVHFLPPYRAENKLFLSKATGINVDALPNHISVELALAVVSLRDKKSDEEIAEIEEACRIGYMMHTTAMKMCRPGIMEREIAGAIEGIALQYGAGVSFTSIVSQNGETLHNHYYGNTLSEGRLLLVDAGAETVMNYCSDFTRTMPVSGKFTTRQKEIYDIVLAANDRAFELSSPGKLYRDIHLEACTVIAKGLTELGIMRGDPAEAVAAGAHALFMPHGLGHMMGLDVHDMEDIGEKYVGYDLETRRSTELGVSALRMGRRLQPGMVMTVEPGIYFIPAYIAKWKAEGLNAAFIDFETAERYFDFGGIRIEDDLLVTETGNRMLGQSRVPATTDRIEEFMAEYRG
ncbi:MAG: aminopeptidase P family protein [Rikenellaceae bacterium]|nr:aminopeptidase P family protein [Rikenellaceae bacterium]